MYWKLLLPTKYAFQRSTTKGLFYPAEQKLYPLDIMRPLIVVWMKLIGVVMIFSGITTVTQTYFSALVQNGIMTL